MGATGKYLKAINSRGATESVPIFWDKETVQSFAPEYVRIGGVNSTDGYMYLPAMETSSLSYIQGQGREVVDARPNFYYKMPSSGGTYSQIFEEFSFYMPRDGYLLCYINYDGIFDTAELPFVVLFYRIDYSMSLEAHAPSHETAITNFYGDDMMSGCWKYRDWSWGVYNNVTLLNTRIPISGGNHSFRFGIYLDGSANDTCEGTVSRYTLIVKPAFSVCNTTSIHATQNGKEFTLVSGTRYPNLSGGY